MNPPRWTVRAAEIVVPSRRADMLEETIDGEVIFADPRNGGVFHLNETAIEIWRRCDGRTTTRTIARAIAGGRDVDLDTALDDVEQVVTMFAESGLLQTDSAGSGGSSC